MRYWHSSLFSTGRQKLLERSKANLDVLMASFDDVEKSLKAAEHHADEILAFLAFFDRKHAAYILHTGGDGRTKEKIMNYMRDQLNNRVLDAWSANLGRLEDANEALMHSVVT